MTPAEITRAVESKNRVAILEAKQKATFDYIQANLIIKGVSLCLGDKSSYPTIQQAYPNLFDDVIEEQKEKIQGKQDTLSVIRFKQFAQSYNNQYKGVQN